MREILFRGKRTDNGEWAEGYLTRRPSAIQYEAHYSPWFIDTPPSDPDDSGGFYNVEKETVGQFTGLTDKNGKRIFEGDIIKNEYSQGIFRKFDVRYDGVLGCWIATVKNTSPHFLYNLIGKIEIIGNIHDNPELIEREGQE